MTISDGHFSLDFFSLASRKCHCISEFDLLSNKLSDIFKKICYDHHSVLVRRKEKLVLALKVKRASFVVT